MSRARTPMPWRGEELHGRVQEADGGFGLLIGQHLGEGHARVIVDGHMQGQEAWMFLLAAQPAIAAQLDLREARHALDIEMQQIAGRGDVRSAARAAVDSDRAIGSAGRGAGCG